MFGIWIIWVGCWIVVVVPLLITVFRIFGAVTSPAGPDQHLNVNFSGLSKFLVPDLFAFVNSMVFSPMANFDSDARFFGFWVTNSILTLFLLLCWRVVSIWTLKKRVRALEEIVMRVKNLDR